MCTHYPPVGVYCKRRPKIKENIGMSLFSTMYCNAFVLYTNILDLEYIKHVLVKNLYLHCAINCQKPSCKTCFLLHVPCVRTEGKAALLKCLSYFLYVVNVVINYRY